MARIPEQELTRLKQEISLQRVVESAGIVFNNWGQVHIKYLPFSLICI